VTADATAGAAGPAPDRWEEEGRRVAPALDRVAGVVVLGTDADSAASVALGIGRVQATRRRVAIADLVGEVAPLQSLVRGDDPHGVVDSFLYGVSLNRIARPVDGTGNLFVLPSGSEPVVAAEIFRSERWGRLATGFRDVGALLILVAPSAAEGVETLVSRVDGVVLAGRATPVPEGANVIVLAEAPAVERIAETAVVEPPVVEPPVVAPPEVEPRVVEPPLALTPASADVPAEVVPPRTFEAPEPDAQPTAAGDAPSESPAEAPATVVRPAAARWVRRIAEAPPTRVNLQTISASRPPADESAGDEDLVLPRPRRWPYALAAGLVVVAAGAAFLARGGDTRSDAGRRAVTPAPVAVADSSPAAPSDSLVAPAVGSAAAGGATTAAGEVAATNGGTTTSSATATTGLAAPRSVVSNPGDSAGAAAYSVQIVAANTIDGARAKLRDVALGLPAAVISPMSLGADSTRWYRLTVGAFADRQSAIAYLRQVRTTRKLDLEAENVVRLPFALLLDGRVPRSMGKATAANYVARGLPAYALAQSDGTARIYAGAFETPEQAGLLADLLRTAGIEPVVAYRTGRGF